MSLLITLAEVPSVKFLHYEVTFASSFLYCTLWKEVTMHSLQLKSEEYVHILFEIFLHEICIYLFVYLFNHLFYQCKLMDIYFIL